MTITGKELIALLQNLPEDEQLLPVAVQGSNYVLDATGVKVEDVRVTDTDDVRYVVIESEG